MEPDVIRAVGGVTTVFGVIGVIATAFFKWLSGRGSSEPGHWNVTLLTAALVAIALGVLAVVAVTEQQRPAAVSEQKSPAHPATVASAPVVPSCNHSSPTVHVAYKGNPLVLEDQENNGNVNATIAMGQNTFRAQLEADGHTNAKMLDPQVPEGGHAGHRWYRIYLFATYGGEMTFGPNPRCPNAPPTA
ncbi:hypothetical protein DVT68_10570 [Dyella solisilvae]|uniref:Uncharacterized protein n=1 Tax=Dyella solisilvae TaxID=1920168 RepID=A0A370K8F0_9GAMM|nr:hypothetical protein [Dyella solisilvae]RDI98931.1 hypothetical protein DVT68_10570 [Dyella solisilvae]